MLLLPEPPAGKRKITRGLYSGKSFECRHIGNDILYLPGRQKGSATIFFSRTVDQARGAIKAGHVRQRNDVTRVDTTQANHGHRQARSNSRQWRPDGTVGLDIGDGQLVTSQAISTAAVRYDFPAALHITRKAAQWPLNSVIHDFPTTVIIRQAVVSVI